MYFLFSDGLKSTQEAIATPPTLYPHHLYPSTYVQAWDRLDIARLLWNTLYYAFGALAFQLIFDVTAAYALSKLRPCLGNVIFFLMLATLMIPSTVLVVPQYVTMANLPILHLNLIGTPGGDLAAVGRQCASTSSCSSGSSTRSRPTTSTPPQIDGASRLTILWRIVLPISRPILGVVSIFGLVAVWKDFLWPLLVEYGYSPTRETLNVGIWQASSAPRRRT